MEVVEFKGLIKNVSVLTSITFILGGCLSSEDAPEEVVVEPDPPPGNSAPQISGSPSSAVAVGEMYSFTPNASDPNGDTLSFTIDNPPGWAGFDTGTGELSGQPTLGNVGLYENILISVSDGKASTSLPQFSISVDQVGTFSTTLSWTAPTQNEDGSALTDLSGYKLYWGTTPGSYPNSVTIDDAGTTIYVVENLSAGTYEFVATSFNTAGVESRYSGSATKVLQ